MKDFLKELKNRNVYRVATPYVVSGWLVIQVLDTMGINLGWSSEIASWITKVLIACFPVALVLAWIYELIPRFFGNIGYPRAVDLCPGRSQSLVKPVRQGPLGYLFSTCRGDKEHRR